MSAEVEINTKLCSCNDWMKFANIYIYVIFAYIYDCI